MPCSKPATAVPPPPAVPKAVAKPYSIPSPPRISDLRRKYGIAISAAGHSPTYSSTPSASPPPVRLPKPTKPASKPAPAAAPVPALQAGAAPVIKSKKPTAARESVIFPVLTSPAVAAIKEESEPERAPSSATKAEPPVLKITQPPAAQRNVQTRPAGKTSTPVPALQIKLPAQVRLSFTSALQAATKAPNQILKTSEDVM